MAAFMSSWKYVSRACLNFDRMRLTSVSLQFNSVASLLGGATEYMILSCMSGVISLTSGVFVLADFVRGSRAAYFISPVE